MSKAEAPALDLEQLDRRLEDVERLLNTLSRQLEVGPVLSPAKQAPLPAATVELPAAVKRPSPEHEALRALAGRA